MSKILQVTEYKEEGFAIIEDNIGKYIATKKSSDTISLDETLAWFGRSTPCALLQSRQAMLT